MHPSLKTIWTAKHPQNYKILRKTDHILYAKAILSKYLMLSQFPYALQTLANRETTPRKIDTVIHGFIWKRKYNNKRAFEKIKRNVVSLPIEEGGLSLINIEHHQNRILAKWASKRSQTNEATWTITAKEQFTSLGGHTVALNDSVPPPPQPAPKSTKVWKQMQVTSGSKYWKRLHQWITRGKSKNS